jgi:threonine/homoserine/homoserine lactone efflux protein
LFVSAALVLLLIPGPAVLYIVARSAEQGRLAGFVSDLGIHSATLVHVLAAALGLSALLASSATAFSLVKYAGAAYLIYIGFKKIFGPIEPDEAGGALKRYRHAQLFRDGFIVNLLNPKTALFFFAFLPQFAEVGRGHLAMQIAFLGLLFTALGFVTDGCYAQRRRRVAATRRRLSSVRALRKRRAPGGARLDRGGRRKSQEIAAGDRRSPNGARGRALTPGLVSARSRSLRIRDDI